MAHLIFPFHAAITAHRQIPNHAGIDPRPVLRSWRALTPERTPPKVTMLGFGMFDQ
jgi:hypothetical protein